MEFVNFFVYVQQTLKRTYRRGDKMQIFTTAEDAVSVHQCSLSKWRRGPAGCSHGRRQRALTCCGCTALLLTVFWISPHTVKGCFFGGVDLVLLHLETVSDSPRLPSLCHLIMHWCGGTWFIYFFSIYIYIYIYTHPSCSYYYSVVRIRWDTKRHKRVRMVIESRFFKSAVHMCCVFFTLPPQNDNYALV